MLVGGDIQCLSSYETDYTLNYGWSTYPPRPRTPPEIAGRSEARRTWESQVPHAQHCATTLQRSLDHKLSMIGMVPSFLEVILITVITHNYSYEVGL